jgi:hypothetical protein
VFESRLLSRIFESKREEVTGEWRRLHNVEVNEKYSSQNIIRVIKSRRMRWAEHVACKEGKERRTQALGWGNLRERGHLERHRSRWEDNRKADLQEVG